MPFIEGHGIPFPIVQFWEIVLRLGGLNIQECNLPQAIRYPAHVRRDTDVEAFGNRGMFIEYDNLFAGYTR